jgi:hypothetical protein
MYSLRTPCCPVIPACLCFPDSISNIRTFQRHTHIHTHTHDDDCVWRSGADERGKMIHDHCTSSNPRLISAVIFKGSTDAHWNVTVPLFESCASSHVCLQLITATTTLEGRCWKVVYGTDALWTVSTVNWANVRVSNKHGSVHAVLWILRFRWCNGHRRQHRCRPQQIVSATTAAAAAEASTSPYAKWQRNVAPPGGLFR